MKSKFLRWSYFAKDKYYPSEVIYIIQLLGGLLTTRKRKDNLARLDLPMRIYYLKIISANGDNVVEHDCPWLNKLA
jgi:hypothetical protein